MTYYCEDRLHLIACEECGTLALTKSVTPQVAANFTLRKPTLTPPNETPPCYQPDGDGCAYQCYDGDDEPIDKCKECPLCYSDKQRHHALPNEPLTQADIDKMHFDRVWIDYGVDDSGERCWEEGVVLYGKLYDIDTLDGSAFEELLLDACDGETLDRPSGDYKVYRRLPGEAE